MKIILINGNEKVLNILLSEFTENEIQVINIVNDDDLHEKEITHSRDRKILLFDEICELMGKPSKLNLVNIIRASKIEMSVPVFEKTKNFQKDWKKISRLAPHKKWTLKRPKRKH